MRRKKIEDADMGHIAVMLDSGMTSQQIAPIIGVSPSAVRVLKKLLDDAREGRRDELLAAPHRSMAAFAAARYGISLEELPPIPDTPAALPAPAPANIDAAQLLDAIQEMIRETRATRDAMEAVASAVSRTNGALANIEQALHSESKQTRDYINANCDILYKPLEAMQNTLVSIQRLIKK